MDRNTIGNEIEAEINASYRYKNLRELIDILLSVIILKTGKKELVGIEERLYVSLGKIFDGETTINDIKLCLSNVIKIEPLLKKMILLIDEDEYDKIVQENLGLAHVITQLGLNPDNKKLDRKPEDYLCDGNYMEHVARSYALRNSESHTYVGWTRREIYTNLDSVLITCLRAVEINKKALISNLKKKSINNELNIENYLNEITQQLKKRMSRFIHIRGEENFSVLGSYVIEYQDDTSDSRRRKGTVEYLRDNSIPERRMMIWGEAGMGKTTTLEYLTYMDAKKRLKDSNYNIPVLVLLGVMTKATYTIKQYICDKLDIGVDICESLLEEGKINLFLDGLNEIPADAGGNLKTLRMREIKQLLRDYPKTFIIITRIAFAGPEINAIHSVGKDLLYSINSEDYDAKRAEFIQRLSKGEKLFVISSYNTVGAGQNLQYKAPGNATIVAVNDYDRGDMEKDFDCIYLEKPTNLLVNVDSKKGIEAEDLIRFVYQMEFLMERGEVSRKDGIAVIKDAFICFSGGYTFSGKKGEPYKTDSVNNYALRTLIQAVGRICRTGLKNPDIYIYVDNTILTDYDLSIVEQRMLNPEFAELVKVGKIYYNGQANKNLDIAVMENRAGTLALKAMQIINELKRNWTDDSIDYWKAFSYNNNTLKRVSNENKDRRENFIIKPVDGERGSITFFDFTDYETFSCTKMGVLYDILNALHDEFGKYIRVKFKQYSIDEVLEYKRASLELYKDIVKKEVLNSGINIVDAVHSETSEDYLQDVADGINKIIPEAKCSVGKRLSKKKLNVRYIHDKSFYSDSEVDPHQESMEDYVVQHITVENFKHQSSAAVYNILKELVIKKDIATGKITLVDWSQYGYKADWLFGVVVDGTYYFMTIHPDGSFKIEALKRNLFTMTEYDKYMYYFGLNEENKNDYRGVIGLVKDAEGNIIFIKDTNMYSMPDYTAMGDVLKNVASEGRFPGKDVVTWLRLVMDTTDKIKVQAELDIVIPHIDVNAEYTKANVMGLFKGITTKKEVVRYVFENTGIMLYAYLRGEEERREYLSGNIDINYFDYDDTHAKYSVGEIGNGMKYTIERASVVREIQAVEGSKLIFKKVLPLMGVEFVRYGMLTVVPFPFKYLREYIVKEEKSV